MILGHWDAEPFDNYKPKRQDNRRDSRSTHQNHYYQKYNSQSHSYRQFAGLSIIAFGSWDLGKTLSSPTYREYIFRVPGK